ncbi:MAG: hypothetical protein QOD58_305 [Mycobacterium sp.]|nr:hypothetical protein [Mycobacterium sp.]
MIVSYLADSTSGAELAGRIVGALLFPALGLILLIIGLRSRSKSSGRQSSIGYPPGYLPGYPQPPGYPPPGYAQVHPGYPGGGFPPMPPPARKAGTGLIVTGIVFLVLGAIGVAGTAALTLGMQSRLAVGDCFSNEILDNSGWRSISCRNPEAVLEYAGTTDSSGNCPDGKLDSSGYLSVKHDGSRRCFLPNLLENHCYTSERNDETIRPVSCGATGKVVRIVTRVDGIADTSACRSGSSPVTFPQPKRTYCSERVGNTI